MAKKKAKPAKKVPVKKVAKPVSKSKQKPVPKKSTPKQVKSPKSSAQKPVSKAQKQLEQFDQPPEQQPASQSTSSSDWTAEPDHPAAPKVDAQTPQPAPEAQPAPQPAEPVAPEAPAQFAEFARPEPQPVQPAPQPVQSEPAPQPDTHIDQPFLPDKGDLVLQVKVKKTFFRAAADAEVLLMRMEKAFNKVNTDMKGKAFFRDLSPGEYTVAVTYNGKFYRKEITLKKSQTIKFKV